MENEKYFHEKLSSIETVVVEMKNQQERMTKAIELLARVEERQSADHDELVKIQTSQDKIFDRIRTIEERQITTKTQMSIGGKIAHMVGGAFLAIITSLAIWKLKS